MNQCNHCDRKDETVRQYQEVDAQGSLTGKSDWMCDTCYFGGADFPFPGQVIDTQDILKAN